MINGARSILSRLIGVRSTRSKKLEFQRDSKKYSQDKEDELIASLAELRSHSITLEDEVKTLKTALAERERAAEGDALDTTNDSSLISYFNALVHSGRLQVIIPTIDSAQYIDIILSYYKNIGTQVRIIVDSKTKDNTISVARNYFDVEVMENPTTRVHGIIEKFSRTSSAEWILRIDDDELPSHSMIQFISTIINNNNAIVYGFPRIQCAVSRCGDILASTIYGPVSNRQWRLYRPDCVTYVDHGHTPGFSLPEQGCYSAPSSACLTHLDWSLHSYANRLSKIERYDDHTPNHGSMWRSYYLYEEDEKHHAGGMKKVQRAEFYQTAQCISQRFPDNCFLESSKPIPTRN